MVSGIAPGQAGDDGLRRLLSGEDSALHLVDQQPGQALQGHGQKGAVGWRRVERHPHPTPGGLLQDVAHAAGLILQKHHILRREVVQHPVHKGLIQLAVAACMEEDAVLPGGVHLDDGVAVAAAYLLHKLRMYAGLFQLLPQEQTLFADAACVPGLHPGPGQGNGLVEALAAAVDLKLL